MTPPLDLILDAGMARTCNGGCWEWTTVPNSWIFVKRRIRGLLADISTLLPLRSFFDYAICIAVLHHLPDFSTRMTALKSMKDALVPGAKFLIFVWALERNGSVGRHKELVWLNAQDVLVPWHQKDDTTIVQRFYHLFREGELEELITSVDDLCIDVSGYDKDNWYVTGHRMKRDE